ncbi:serine protease [Acidovorax sp. SUPP2539]|uniref:S1 family peptidase n=1 Tax=Acidovorax sp. SUPP2539 TaxID=2920878 RepID=UPI0023DE1CA2|nr:serine protease [Acidovorax sp. SUPP2539]GKS90723.1 serine protease [Acidovorax sp. SUPP2539]
MKNLQDVTERICELKGSLIAIDALLPALLDALPSGAHDTLARSFDAHVEAARTVMLHAPISDHVLSTFERDAARMHGVIAALPGTPAPLAESESESGPVAQSQAPATESVLLTSTRISTFDGPRSLTGASGFFFRRDGRLFLVTSRHVLADAPSAHFPDRIEIDLHLHPQDLTRVAVFSLPLYRDGLGLWRQAVDSGGEVDVSAIEIDTARLPEGCVFEAFDASHLQAAGDPPQVGDALVVIGFPLGFHDTVHRLPVVRAASVASAYGVRFQQQGYFLTDARTHRGSSGAPVLRRRVDAGPVPLPWQLLGVHSTRMDMSTRDLVQDESLGLNCAWYADVLMALTGPGPAAAPPVAAD